MEQIFEKKRTFYYETDKACMVLGDALKILTKISAESVDMIFADPPYFLSNDGITCQSGKMVSVNKGSWDKLPKDGARNIEYKHKFNRKWIRLCRQILKPNGSIWISGTYHNIYSIGMALEQEAFKIINNITWQKTNPPPNLSCRCFTHSTETILWAQKNDKTSRHFFDYQAMKELNGGKSVNAVFVVGGGGKVPGFTEKLAENLGILKERVALRGAEVMGNIDFIDESIKKDSLLVTPIGICLNFYNQKNSFIFIYFNGERMKLYDNDKLTIMDAVMQADYPNDFLFPRRGKELEFYVNGRQRIIRGEVGDSAVILLNGETVNLQTSIKQNDRIIIKESTIGEPAVCTLDSLPEYEDTIIFEVEKRKIVCPKFTQVNGKLEAGYYQIKQNDKIEFLDYYTAEQVAQFLDINLDMVKLYINNRLADRTDKVYENFSLKWKELTGTYEDLLEIEEDR